MKNILFLIFALLQISVLFSQRVKYGFKGGLNYTVINFSVPELNNEGSRIVSENQEKEYGVGMHLGVFTEIGLNRKLTFKPELVLSFQNSVFHQKRTLEQDYLGNPTSLSIDKSTSLSTTYLNIPFLVKFYVLNEVYAFLGPQMGILLNATNEAKGTSSSITTYNDSVLSEFVDLSTPERNVTEDYRPVSFGLVLGCGYFLTQNLFFEGRYNFGISNDARTIDYQGLRTDQTSKSSTFQLSLGYRY